MVGFFLLTALVTSLVFRLSVFCLLLGADLVDKCCGVVVLLLLTELRRPLTLAPAQQQNKTSQWVKGKGTV